MTNGDGAELLGEQAHQILAQLQELRKVDAPTHGGHVLSYVYDSGLAELDELAAQAARIVQPVNGLDPTTFPSVAALERDVVDFTRRILGGCIEGDEDVVGSVTSGGTESCLLAVKTARDLAPGRRRIVAPSSVHAAFHKAAQYFGMQLDLVPVDPLTGAVAADDVVARLGDDVALVVLSAPAYPHGCIDPIFEVATAAAAQGIACHVDACFGGWVLPWWSADVPLWDFRVAGVTSISADLHKYGYAPKGVSVLLHRGRARHRGQFFAMTKWPGYPVVNPTLLGSRPAGPLAAAWAIIRRLGDEGFQELTSRVEQATERLLAGIEKIDGLRVFGTPTGPAIAVAADDAVGTPVRVDPHLWADRLRAYGWVLQEQPGFTQSDGTHIPHTTHLTVTPVTQSVLGDDDGDGEGLLAAMGKAADDVRGTPGVDGQALAGEVGLDKALAAGAESSDLLAQLGLDLSGGQGMPQDMAPLMALIETMPAQLVEGLLTELLASVARPE